VSITIIGAGLGGLIVGSGGTYFLLNPRISQAEAEKAALAEQLRTVTDQLRQLQDQVAELQQQVKLSSPSSVEPMALPSKNSSVSSGEFPLPLPPTLSETIPTPTSLADRYSISGATVEMPRTAELSPLADEVPEGAIAGWPEAPDLSSAAALKASTEIATTIAELAAIDEAEASLHPMDAISSSQTSGGLELGSSHLQQTEDEPEWLIPEDLTQDVDFSTFPSLSSGHQELAEPVLALPSDHAQASQGSEGYSPNPFEPSLGQEDSLKLFGLDLEETWVHAESDFPEVTVAPLDSQPPSQILAKELLQAAMGADIPTIPETLKAQPIQSFELGLDAEATWVHAEQDFPNLVEAPCPPELPSHSDAWKPSQAAMSADSQATLELSQAKPAKSFELGLDAEATWVHAEQDFPNLMEAPCPSASPSHKSPAGAPEAFIPVIDVSQTSTANPFSLGVDPEATWVHPESEH
jgi:hypothetical protein